MYREAMGNGGEMEGWRGALRSQALRGAGRTEEAVELAEWAAETSRRRGLRWSLPIALLALGRALAVEAGTRPRSRPSPRAPRLLAKPRPLPARRLESEREALTASAAKREARLVPAGAVALQLRTISLV
jgi:hypothetical protein